MKTDQQSKEHEGYQNYVPYYTDADWDTMYFAPQDEALSLYNVLIDDLTTPLRVYDEPNWDVRRNMLKEAGKIADKRGLDFLKVYLNLFINGGRYIMDDNAVDELKPLKVNLDLRRIKMSWLIEQALKSWMVNGDLSRIEYVPSIREDWAGENEDFYHRMKGLQPIWNKLLNDVRMVDIDKVDRRTDPKRATNLQKMRQVATAIANYSLLEI